MLPPNGLSLSTATGARSCLSATGWAFWHSRRWGSAAIPDHTLHVICELGEGHPQTCLMDGIQAATGATFGKTLIEKTGWGKLAATFWYPGKTAVRYALRASFLDEFGKQEFFAYRQRGIEPSAIPAAVAQEVDRLVSRASPPTRSTPWRRAPTSSYQPVKGSFNKSLCSKCGEYVFERYVRQQDGKPVCIPCSGHLR